MGCLTRTFSPRSNITSGSATPATWEFSSAPTMAPSPSATQRSHKLRSLVRKIDIAIFGFLVRGVAGTTSGFVCCLLFKSLSLIRGREKDTGPSIYSPLIKKVDDLVFLEKEDALQSLEVIRRGGCRVVYKGELLGSDRKIIAIKKIIPLPKNAAELTEEDSRAFNKKMHRIRTEIRHRNSLPLLAHLSRLDQHYLVYEYIKNGSLQDMLEKVSPGTTYS